MQLSVAYGNYDASAPFSTCRADAAVRTLTEQVNMRGLGPWESLARR